MPRNGAPFVATVRDIEHLPTKLTKNGLRFTKSEYIGDLTGQDELRNSEYAKALLSDYKRDSLNKILLPAVIERAHYGQSMSRKGYHKTAGLVEKLKWNDRRTNR